MAEAQNIGTYHLAQNPTLYEPQRTNNFEFIVTGIDQLLRAGVTTTDDSDFISNGQEVLRLSVKSSDVPNFEQDVIEIRRGNNVMKVAGVPKFSSGSLVINDFIGADGKSVLMAWQRLSYDVTTEKVGRMADYKKDCQLIEYTPDYEQVRYWELKGCWISKLDTPTFDMESNNKSEITATIEFDKAIMHLPDEQA